MSARSMALLVTASTMVVTAPLWVPASSTGAEAGRAAVGAKDTWGLVHRFEQDPQGQSMVVDSRGVTTVVWGSQQRWPEPVKVAQRTAAGHWRAPVSLGTGYWPVVAADPAGNLVVAYCRDRKNLTTGVWAVRKRVGRPWTRPVHLSRDVAAPGYPDGGSVFGAWNLDVAARPGGAAIVTWTWGNWEREVPFRVQAAYRPSGGPWAPMDPLTPAVVRAGVQAGDAHVALAPDGTAWVAYRREPASGPTRILVRSHPVAGEWRPATRVGTGGVGDLKVTARGDVVVVFARGGRVRVTVRPAATAAWKTPVAVTPATVHVRTWSVAMNRAGAAVVAYLARHRVHVTRRTAGGTWTHPKILAEPGFGLSGVTSAVNARGDMFVGWDNSYGIWGRSRTAGEAWHAATTAQPDRGQADVLEDVQAKVAPRGNVVLLWAQEERALRARVLNVS